MSIEMVARAVNETRTKGAEKLILMLLAFHHNGQTGLCCPSAKLLSEESGLSHRIVQRYIGQLKAKGILNSIPFGRGVKYQFQTPIFSENDLRTIVRNSGGEDENDLRTIVRCLTNNSSLTYEPEFVLTGSNMKEQELSCASTCASEPSEESESKKTKADLSKVQQDRFDRFWSAYPKKKSKGQAKKAWNKLKPNEELLNTMINAINALKETNDWLKDEGQFIPYPATWLNAEGWEDAEATGQPINDIPEEKKFTPTVRAQAEQIVSEYKLPETLKLTILKLCESGKYRLTREVLKTVPEDERPTLTASKMKSYKEALNATDDSAA